MSKVPYGLKSFDATFRAIQRPLLSPADRFALIQRAGDSILAAYPVDKAGYLLNVMEAMVDVASNNRPDPESVAILRDAVENWA